MVLVQVQISWFTYMYMNTLPQKERTYDIRLFHRDNSRVLRVAQSAFAARENGGVKSNLVDLPFSGVVKLSFGRLLDSVRVDVDTSKP